MCVRFRYVSFPTQTLFKCFKMVPVMLMGKVIGNKAYPTYDYAVAIMIGFGISIFMVSTEPMEFGLTSAGLPETWGGTLCGLVLLFLFLCFDSFTGQWQSRMFHRNEDLSPAVMMLMVNAFSLVFSGITLVHTKEMGPFIEFLVKARSSLFLYSRRRYAWPIAGGPECIRNPNPQ